MTNLNPYTPGSRLGLSSCARYAGWAVAYCDQPPGLRRGARVLRPLRGLDDGILHFDPEACAMGLSSFARYAGCSAGCERSFAADLISRKMGGGRKTGSSQ